MLSLIATLQTLGFTAKERLRDEKGATAVEYGLMVALIAVAIILTIGLMGTELNRLFAEVLAALTAA